MRTPTPTRHEAFRVLGAAWLAALCSACTQGDGDQPGQITRDSAGIQIVESTQGVWTEETAWSVSRSPTLVIGAAEGPAEQQLFRARDARKLPDGRVVVVNSGTSELKFFDAAGHFLHSAGRAGEGPGEYETLGWIRCVGEDSLLAYDLGRWGGSILDRDGNFGRSFRLAPGPDQAPVFGLEVLPDGTVLALAETQPGGWALGPDRTELTYVLYRSDGERIGGVGTFPGKDIYVQTLGGGNSGPRIAGSPPFGRKPGATVRGSEFCLATADTYEIACYGTDGALRQLIRHLAPPRSVTNADVEQYVAMRLARIDGEARRREWEPRIRALPVPETMPPYDTLATDSRDRLWVREMPPLPGGQRRWTVFDTDGGMLGSVDFPVGLEVTQIGDDFVLGIWRDELDVEYVREYALIKP